MPSERRVQLLLLAGIKPEAFTQELLDAADWCIDEAHELTLATGRRHYAYNRFMDMMRGPPRA